MSQAPTACYRPPAQAERFRLARKARSAGEATNVVNSDTPKRVFTLKDLQEAHTRMATHQRALQFADELSYWIEPIWGPTPLVTAARIREIVEMCRAVRNVASTEPALTNQELGLMTNSQLDGLFWRVMGTDAHHIRYQVTRELALRGQ